MKNSLNLIGLILFTFIFFISCKNEITQTETHVKTREVIIPDYMYLKNTYFFIDENYYNQYEKGYSSDFQIFTYEQGKSIVDIDVFVNTIPSDSNTVKGLAVLNPDEYIGLSEDEYEKIKSVEGKIEKTYLHKLDCGKDYNCDYYRGFFWLNTPASENEIICVSYTTDGGDKVGTLYSDIQSDTNAVLVCRLIKPAILTPSNKDLWKLTMRNVYSIPDTVQPTPNNSTIKIEYNNGSYFTDKQSEEPKNTFINLLGLDVLDKTASIVDKGDGLVDFSYFIIPPHNKIIIFPSLQPFDPNIGSPLQLNETNRAKIYDIPPNDLTSLILESKFRIVIEYFE